MGRIVTTAQARQRLTEADILNGVRRHQSGDWGDLADADRKENERSLNEGHRLVSVYHATTGIKFQIITEADRSASTVLLPEDN
jgi:hypothetical protein